MENSFLKRSKKKQIGKIHPLTSVETLKTPKGRRKSLGTVLPTPNLDAHVLDLNRRKSVDLSLISKKSKKQMVLGLGHLSDNAFNELATPTLTTKKASKRPSIIEPSPSTTLENKKKNIQLRKSHPLLVLAPKDEDSESPLKSLKKKHKKENLKLEKNIHTVKLENPEEKFGVKAKDVENAVKGVIKFASNNPRLQNKLFNEEIPLFLQINSFKVPKTKGPVKQLFKIPVPNSILPTDSDICLIVPDVKGIKNNEHEKHLEHYENLLRLKDVTGIKKIMTFHEFRTEYETFELKNRLVDLYDAFLVDGKISGKVVNKCGSIFYNKRKVPTSIKLYIPKLKSHIDKALKKVYFCLNVKSDSHTVQIGHSKNSTDDLVENIYTVIKYLTKHFPGKMDNIRSLNVYAHRGSSIPIYVSLKNPNEIKVPTLYNKKPKAYKSFKGELTTQNNADVIVKPGGQVIIVKQKKTNAKQKVNQDEDITDAEILRENKKIDQIEQQNGDGDNKNKKGSKKRKLSESMKDHQDHIPGQFVLKKVKREKKPINATVKQEVLDDTGKQSKKGKKKNSNKKFDPNSLEEGKTDKIIQRTVKNKTKVFATEVKSGENAAKQKIVKIRNAKKL